MRKFCAAAPDDWAALTHQQSHRLTIRVTAAIVGRLGLRASSKLSPMRSPLPGRNAIGLRSSMDGYQFE